MELLARSEADGLELGVGWDLNFEGMASGRQLQGDDLGQSKLGASSHSRVFCYGLAIEPDCHRFAGKTVLQVHV